MSKFCFGDIVVVPDNYIGVIVNEYTSEKLSLTDTFFEVYVRTYSCVKRYTEKEIERFLVRPAYLSGDELTMQKKALNT